MTRTNIYMKETANSVMITDLVAPNVWALDYGTYEDDLVLIDGQWLIECRTVHMPHPENTTVGKIEEYFTEFWGVSQNYRD